MACEIDRETIVKKLEALNLYMISSETSEEVLPEVLRCGRLSLVQDFSPLSVLVQDFSPLSVGNVVEYSFLLTKTTVAKTWLIAYSLRESAIKWAPVTC